MDLQQIDGIGPVAEMKLKERGITSLQALAICEFSQIEDIRGASEQWILDAKAMVAPDQPIDIQWDIDEGVYVGNAETNEPEEWEEYVGFGIKPDDMAKIIGIRDAMAASKHDPSITIEDALRALVNERLISMGEQPLV